MSAILKKAGKLREMEKTDRALGRLLGTNRVNVNDTNNQKVALPHDYKYDNGEPYQKVKPSAYFGDTVNLEKYENSQGSFCRIGSLPRAIPVSRSTS